LFGSAEASSLRRATAPRWPSSPSGAHSPKGRGCTVPPAIANRHRYSAPIPARHHRTASDSRLRIAVLAPISWRTPPRHYGPWEQFASLLADGLVAAGHDVTLFATADSLTTADLHATASSGWSDDPAIEPKVAECIHIASAFERAADFDIIHNGFDFLPLTYSGLVNTPVVTTIHGFSSPRIVPVYERYDATTHYVAISDADRHPHLHYAATIHHGIATADFDVASAPGEHLLYFGRIHPDKGTAHAIAVARQTGRRLDIAGIIQDEDYFRTEVEPYLGDDVRYLGPVAATERSAVLGGAHALLHLIDFDEPFGYSVVEALACGTPVIANGRGSMPELIDDGATGFLVGTIEGAVDAVGDADQLDRIAIRATAVERFDVSRMIERYVAVYSDILN
jgi:glycosyltransferase involved in cell wall biosynthesis